MAQEQNKIHGQHSCFHHGDLSDTPRQWVSEVAAVTLYCIQK